MPRRIATVCPLALLAVTAGAAAQNRYLADFEFIRDTVGKQGAAIKTKKIDWKAACRELRPAFAACSSDREHVRNVMRLLARVGDSHTDVRRSSVPWQELPSKWDGLYGAGIWVGWESGRFMIRGVMPGHAQESQLERGSAIVAIDGVPFWYAMAREHRRIADIAGVSSLHSLYASLGNRLFPFGERQDVELTLVTPAGKSRNLRMRRWGPGGKAFYPSTVQYPEGVTHKDGAVATLLKTPWSDKVGYLRITGSMDSRTVQAFDAALDSIRAMEVLLLDCRGMGGGGDEAAWNMVERLIGKPVANGRQRRLNPRGSWQFTGPVVMLQDELEVSSAETFTWAMSETGRAISVGRPTGGWGIIPTICKCPSGLVDFRLGVNDRPTPIQGIHTEGIGWAPDVRIPYGPGFCRIDDPDRMVAMDILHLLHSGIPRKACVDAFGGLFQGKVSAFEKAGAGFAKRAKGFAAKKLAKLVQDDLRETLLLEIAMLKSADQLPADLCGAEGRLAALQEPAKQAKLTGDWTRLAKLIRADKKDAAAQDAFLTLERQGPPDAAARAAFLKQHGKTRFGRWAGGTWKE